MSFDRFARRDGSTFVSSVGSASLPAGIAGRTATILGLSDLGRIEPAKLHDAILATAPAQGKSPFVVSGDAGSRWPALVPSTGLPGGLPASSTERERRRRRRNLDRLGGTRGFEHAVSEA